MIRPRARPLLVGLGIGVGALLGVLNFAALTRGDGSPVLQALDVASDLAVLAGAIVAIVWFAIRSEAQTELLDATQAQLSAIVDSAMDAIITVDGTQKILLFNEAAERIFRCSREEAIGGPLERFIPARFRAPHHEHVARFGRTGATARRMGDSTALLALRADGSEFPIEASISQAADRGGHLYTVILRDITIRRRYEEEIQRKQAELRTLSAQVLEAREEEKTHIARELHDELGQLLTALKMDLAWMRERLPGSDAGLADKAAQMGQLLDQTVAATRRISADLRPLMLDDLGLAAAAAWLVEDFGRRSGLEARLELPPELELDNLDKATANTAYRALQESLTNIARHANAKHVWVVFEAAGGELRIEIEDDGRGIKPQDFAKARSLGLKGMRERVAYLGGTLEIARAPRGGTRVHFRVPLEAARATEPTETTA